MRNCYQPMTPFVLLAIISRILCMKSVAILFFVRSNSATDVRVCMVHASVYAVMCVRARKHPCPPACHMLSVFYMRYAFCIRCKSMPYASYVCAFDFVLACVPFY